MTDAYRYTGTYRDITTEGELGAEGMLSGPFGDLRFRRCEDGLAIVDSGFAGSGFVSWPTDADIGCPGTINGIPVTEIRGAATIGGRYPIAIEAPRLKRAYLQISSQTAARRTGAARAGSDPFAPLMPRGPEGADAWTGGLRIAVDFLKDGGSIDLCEIRCGERCVLQGIAAKRVRIDAPVAVLKDRAYEELEGMELSGRAYPYAYGDPHGAGSDIGFFAGAKRLKTVEGPLGGEDCWLFRDCASLERVHLANGMRRVPPHSFENCASLTDLYIPDTVTEIGEYAFSGCVSLRTIHLPPGLRKISKGTFSGCASLTKCFLPDEIETIEDEAFRGCAAMRRPWIPKNIRRIGETAFDDPGWRRL